MNFLIDFSIISFQTTCENGSKITSYMLDYDKV